MSNNRVMLLDALAKDRTIYFDDNYEALEERMKLYESSEISKMLQPKIHKVKRLMTEENSIRYILMQQSMHSIINPYFEYFSIHL